MAGWDYGRLGPRLARSAEEKIMAERREGKNKEPYEQVRRRIDALDRKLEQERSQERPTRVSSARVLATPPTVVMSREAVFIKLAFVIAAAVGVFLYFWLHR
jgi:hypothetical protein